jgi:NitT/TauT family transport system substrate-binding protein
MIIAQSRRSFLTNLAAAGAAGLGGVSAVELVHEPRSFAAEPPPEITAIRFQKDPITCIAPQAAGDLLRAEGFTDIRYVESTDEHARRAVAENSSLLASMIAHGEVDFGRDPAPDHIWPWKRVHRSPF